MYSEEDFDFVWRAFITYGTSYIEEMLGLMKFQEESNAKIIEMDIFCVG